MTRDWMLTKSWQVLVLAGGMVVTLGMTPATPETEPAPASTLTIFADRAIVPVAPELYGLFFEDISRSGEGGVYAELIRNRSFEESQVPARCSIQGNQLVSPTGWKRDWIGSDPVPGWTLETGGAGAQMELDQSTPLSSASPVALKVSIPNSAARPIAIVNHGFWGVPVRKGESYSLSLFTRADAAFGGTIEAALVARDGRTLARSSLGRPTAKWRRITTTLVASDADDGGRLVLTTRGKGVFWLDLVSLFPKTTWKNRPNGQRPDLMEMLAALRPQFLRFPGGCVVEGFTRETAWRWKQTVGDISNRPGTYSLWGYRVSNGLGYHEFLQMSEDLGARPLYVVNVGMTCQGRGPELFSMDQLGEWIDDTLDAIEYANGPVTSRWGALRARNGHPEPFNLRFVELGNENWGPDYAERYRRFHQAIKARYPEIRLLADEVVDGAPLDIVDEHFYPDADFFMAHTRHYDNHDPKRYQVYVGEYAVIRDAGKGNLRAAVAEAAFLTGLERNPGVVRMVSYAPTLANANELSWTPNAIYFDATRAYGTPSYHALKLFATHRGDELVSFDLRTPERSQKLVGSPGLATRGPLQIRNLRVESEGRTIYSSSPESGPGDWDSLAGAWTCENGVLSAKEGALVLKAGRNLQNYVYSFEANADPGTTFTATFWDNGNRHAEQDWAHWEIGPSSELQRNVGWAWERLAPAVAAPAADGRWHSYRVELQGDHVRATVDGVVRHEIALSRIPALATVTTRDRATGELVLKVVNTTSVRQRLAIEVSGMPVASPGRAWSMTSESPEDENSFEQPERISPKAQSVSTGPSFEQVLAPWSVTVLRIPSQH